jgi:hypothetical protein
MDLFVYHVSIHELRLALRDVHSKALERKKGVLLTFLIFKVV